MAGTTLGPVAGTPGCKLHKHKRALKMWPGFEVGLQARLSGAEPLPDNKVGKSVILPCRVDLLPIHFTIVLVFTISVRLCKEKIR